MELAQTFDDLDVAALQSYIDNKQEENLQIDFKTTNGSGLTSLDDKRNFCRAMSGFANSSGGLIVWGIDARKNPEGIDCATEFKIIDNLPHFLTRLNKLTGEACSPLASGIRHKTVAFNGSQGCAITLVPESPSGPHMAKLGEDRYYKRSGDSFYKMEHFDIQDMFGRRLRPALDVIITPERDSPDHSHEYLSFTLHNTGRAVAKHVGFYCRFDDGIEIIHTPRPIHNSTNLNNGSPTISFSNSTSVIHPNGMRDFVGRVAWLCSRLT